MMLRNNEQSSITPMRWRDAFFRRFGPNNLGGITLGRWLRVLRDNHFAIDPPFWPRAIATSLIAIPNTLSAGAEQLWYGRKIERAIVEPPLFILGAWRSGTTHLHNLLAQDTRFAFPNQFQVSCPHTFLLAERSAAGVFDWCLPKQRPQDAVKMGAQEPQEEDFAMSAYAGQASLMAWAFPRNAAFYLRYMTMAELSNDELARWTADYWHFLRKLTVKYNRPLVLKSPANTGRIKTLLEMFPQAKFVNIHRHPYEVFQSVQHTLKTAGPYWQLQRANYDDHESITSKLIAQMKALYEGYFEQRTLIPAGHLHEVAYADLEKDPVGQLRATYEKLTLPDFRQAETRVCDYLQSLSGYKKNVLTPSSPALKERLILDWQQCFQEWGYEA